MNLAYFNILNAFLKRKLLLEAIIQFKFMKKLLHTFSGHKPSNITEYIMTGNRDSVNMSES